jgi:putative ABC transport system substrate-binding protein
LPTFKMTAFDPTATLATISKSGIPLPFRKTPLIRYDTRVRMRGSMKRREFIKLVCTGVLASPLPASAQKRTNAVIGMLTAVTPNAVQLATIRKGLDERGYVEGRNLTVLYRSAEGKFDRLPALAADLVGNRVALILAYGSPVPARSAKAATATIPIVFAYGGDPVADGLVASFNRPGGNVTGATFIGTTLSGKKLELLRQLVPQMTDVALLVNRKGTLAENQIRDAELATQTLGQRLHVVDASNEAEIEAAFEEIGRINIDALIVSTDPTLGLLFHGQIIALAARYKIPTMYTSRQEVDDGGLISYSANFLDALHQAAVYAGRILDDEKPADLPIIQPTKFELAINLKTAKALGLSVPPSLLALADEVIE